MSMNGYRLDAKIKWINISLGWDSKLSVSPQDLINFLSVSGISVSHVANRWRYEFNNVEEMQDGVDERVAGNL